MAKVSNRTWLQNTTKLEKRYLPALIRITQKFREQFIKDFKAHGKEYATGNLSLSTITHPALTTVIKDIYSTAGLMGAKMTHAEIKEQVKVKSGGFGRNERWIRDVNDYLKLHALGFVQDITETMRQDIINILQRGTDQGLGIDQIVTELRGIGLITNRARVIARTEVIRAANVGHSIAAADLPYEVSKKWSAARDARTRHSHVYINGHQVDENDTFKVPIYKGDKNTGRFDEMQFPGDPNASAANTINCFLPDELTYVSPQIIEHAFRNWYDGEVITIETSGGKKFTCTPNHPILSTFGWVKAGSLAHGDNLVKSSFINSHALPEFNVNNSPSTFKQVFDAINVEGVGMRVPGVVVNFYGDIPAGDVDIVRPAGLLPNGVHVNRIQRLYKHFFQNACLRTGILFTYRLLNGIKFVKFFRHISNSVVRLFGQFSTIYHTGLGHSQIHRFASITGRNSGLLQPSINNIPRNPVFPCQLLNTDIADSIIGGNGFTSDWFSDASHLNTMFRESLVNVGRATAETITDFLTVHTGIVQSDSIIKIERGYYSGHVYTFETVNQMYDINSYVARNCRCRVLYEAKRDENGRIIMRNQNQARVIPMTPIERIPASGIAAALKANITIQTEI